MKNFKSVYISIAMIMIFLIIVLGFSQLSTEIYVYGFIANSASLRVDELSKNAKRYSKEQSDDTKIISSEQNKKISLKKPVMGITTSVFGDKVSRNVSHKGHDWAVEVGTPVKAAEDGIVEKSYYSASYGYNILLKHNEKLKTRYAHLSRLSVNVGEKVKQGQIIGLSGSTGESTGPHLHFEVEKDGVRENPMDYLE